MSPSPSPNSRRFVTLPLKAAAITAIALVALAGSSLLVAPAHATDLPTPSWWSGVCNTNNFAAATGTNAFQLDSTNGKYRGVAACGPRPYWDAPYVDRVVHFYSGAYGVLEFQCVELVMRYMSLAYGQSPYAGNGKDIVNNYPGSRLQKISNGAVGQAPQPGDVISYGATSGNPAGHTAIVKASSVDGNGNGTVTIIQQNAGMATAYTQSISNWQLSAIGGNPATGWLHDPAPAPTPVLNADLVAIKMNNTGGTLTEAHWMKRSTDYQTYLLQTTTVLGTTTQDMWSFSTGDWNNDGAKDIFAVKMYGTGTNSTEVHILNGATNYQTYLLQTGTPVPVSSYLDYQFAFGDYNLDGTLDFYWLKYHNSDTNTIQVHVLSGATNFQTPLLDTGTYPAQGSYAEWQLDLGDYNYDNRPDLYAVHLNASGGSTDLHIINGATAYSSPLLDVVTALGLVTVDQSQFKVADYDGNGRSDLYQIRLNNTASGKVEVNIMNGAGNYQSWLANLVTPHAPTYVYQTQFDLR